MRRLEVITVWSISEDRWEAHIPEIRIKVLGDTYEGAINNAASGAEVWLMSHPERLRRAATPETGIHSTIEVPTLRWTERTN